MPQQPAGRRAAAEVARGRCGAFSFASDFVKERATAVKGELSALDGDLLKIVNSDPSTVDVKTGTRNEFMKALCANRHDGDGLQCVSHRSAAAATQD